MSKDYEIGALWIGGSLSFLEQLCLKSFVDAGHHVKLFTYGEVQGVPDGIEIVDGNSVLETKDTLVHKRTGSPALQSDLFRYHLLAKNKHMIWADTDAYCVKPFTTPNGHFYAWESAHQVNGGVLGLPQDSDTLRELLDFTADEYAIPEWLPQAQQVEMRAAAEAGNPVHSGEQAWGVWGPRAITHFLHKTGEIKYALPREALYPVSFKDRRLMLKPEVNAERFLTPDTFSIHFYGRRMRQRLILVEGGEPHPDSMIGRLLKKHDIVPADAPLPAAPKKPERLTPQDRHGRGQMNLTDLFDARGSDRGALRHCYSDVYNMLFQPLRQRRLQIALVGLDGGAAVNTPDIWPEEAQKTLDIMMEFFPKAHFTCLDRAAAAPIEDERLTYHQVSLDEADEIDAVADGPFDIVMDDATHASHHQQNALLALFPKLSSGGIYTIEDLRSQPAPLEEQGVVKTAALFGGYLESGIFEHPQDATAADLNEMRQDISGCFVFQAKFQKHRRDQMLVLHKR